MSVIRTFGNPPEHAVVQEAGNVLNRGGILAVPTESFYALAASAQDASGVARVKELKGLSDERPILVLIGDRTQLNVLSRSVPRAAAVLMEAFWPGPLTLTFPIAPAMPDVLASRKGTLGVRQPGHQPLLTLLQYVGPLTGTSANRTGEPPGDSAVSVQGMFGESIDLILDGGKTAGGLASTVVDTVEAVRIIREGPISQDQIHAVLQRAGIKLDDTGLNER